MTPTTDSLPDAIADCSPKAKLAYLYLTDCDSLTCGQLEDRAALPQSTANKALKELVEAGVADRRVDPTNPLAFLYSLKR